MCVRKLQKFSSKPKEGWKKLCESNERANFEGVFVCFPFEESTYTFKAHVFALSFHRLKLFLI